MALPSTQNRMIVDGLDYTSSVNAEPSGYDGNRQGPASDRHPFLEAFRIDTNASPAETVAGGRRGVRQWATKSGANAVRGIRVRLTTATGF
jgi:hypothetical protein